MFGMFGTIIVGKRFEIEEILFSWVKKNSIHVERFVVWFNISWLTHTLQKNILILLKIQSLNFPTIYFDPVLSNNGSISKMHALLVTFILLWSYLFLVDKVVSLHGICYYSTFAFACDSWLQIVIVLKMLLNCQQKHFNLSN